MSEHIPSVLASLRGQEGAPAKFTPRPAHDNAKSQAEAHYASVTEQLEEGKVKIATAETAIVSLKQAIREQQETIRRTKADMAKLQRRRKIFARAKFDLEQVDAE